MAIRLLAAGAWGRMRRAFLGVFSSRGCLHTGFWAKGRHHGPHPVKKRAALEALGLRIGAFSAVLCTRPRARGPRDAEYSGICTAPPGVPVGKKQPPRQSMHLAERFMQKYCCGRVGSSLELESQAGYSALLRAPTMSILLRVRLVARLTINVKPKESTTAST